ncbi:MAG: hypothetical protein U1F87_09730 [Kiritimatiellia bacterium]
MSPFTRSLLLVLAFLAASLAPARGDSPVGQCLVNLDNIENAKLAFGVERSLSPGDEINPGLLADYMGGELPKCPSRGIYLIGRMGEKPTCSIRMHSRQVLEQRLNARRNANIAKSALALIGTAAGCALLSRFWSRKRPVGKGAWKRRLAICVAGYVVSGVLLSHVWSNSMVSAPMILRSCTFRLRRICPLRSGCDHLVK